MNIQQEGSVGRAALLAAATIAMIFCLAAWACQRNTGGPIGRERRAGESTSARPIRPAGGEFVEDFA